MKSQLQGLEDPSQFQGPISIDGISPEILKSMLNSMSVIRKTEQQLAKGRQEGLIGGPVHLGVGQEAVAVGISQLLQKTDRVFGAHRSHSHLLALNPDFYRLFAEVLGKASGFSKGMGGSMHLFDQTNGFFGSTPIVAGTASLAVGAAMAAKLQNLNDVGVAYIGDGAVEEGVVHESFNLAKIQNAPILFAIENNLFSSHMHISLRQPNDKISRFAVANEIPYELVDGNDVVAIFSAAKKQISDMREGKGPRLLELITYRWYGHVDWREDIDVGVNRSIEDLENWKLRDPIKRLCDSMIEEGIWSKEEHDKLGKDIDNKIFEAWNKAVKDDYPHSSSTLKYVYSEENQEDI